MSNSRGEKYWRAEIEPRLKTLKLFVSFQRFRETDGYFSQFESNMIESIYFAHQRAKYIISAMPQYTLHDSDHLFRVCEIMGKIIPDEIADRLSIVDIYLLIMSAFYHDIGMSPTRREVDSWRARLHSDYAPKHSGHDSIANFVAARPEQGRLLTEAIDRRDEEEINNIEEDLISEFIRETHGRRVIDIISDLDDNLFRYRDVNLKSCLVKICESHTQDAMAIRKMDNIVPCGDGIFFCPPFVSVVLRLSDLIDFDTKRAPRALFETLKIENSLSIREWSKHRSISAWSISSSNLSFRAECDHPVIQESLLGFCDQIDAELIKCAAVLRALSDISIEIPRYYRLQLPGSIDRSRIRPKLNASGLPMYNYSKTRFTLDRNRIVELLMGTSLYGNPIVALRELLQNSFDACLSRAAFEVAWGRNFSPKVDVYFNRNEGRHTLVVLDNGIGMDQRIISEFYATIGSSYYRSSEFYTLLAKYGVSFTSVSRFGIGVLSYFLVANRLTVNSRRLISRYELSEPVNVRVDGINGLFWIGDGRFEEVGTETTLELLPEHPWKELDSDEIIEQFQKIIPTPTFPINIIIDGDTITYHGAKNKSEKIDLLGGVSSYYPNVEARVRTQVIASENVDLGFSIDASVFWLEQHGRPTSRFDYFSRSINVAGQDEELEMTNYIEARKNKLTSWSTSLGFVDGKVRTNSSYRDFLESEIRLSLHGFGVPIDAFHVKSEGMRLVPQLNWPFVARIDIRINQPGDLNLTAARDGIIPDAKWHFLSQWIFKSILTELEKKLDKKYFKFLVNLWKGKTLDGQLRSIMTTFEG